MKRLYKTLILLLLTISYSCQYIQKEIKQSDSEKNGPTLIKSYYEKSGALKSEITIIDNKKNGPARKYYPTGEIHTIVNYVNNIKEGETIWYYKNGQAYRVTPYLNGKMHGIRKIYYENGKLQAEIPYKNGDLVTGTKEYDKKGKIIPENTTILIEALDNLRIEDKFILKIKLSKRANKVQFFEEKTSTENVKYLYPITTNQSGTAIIEYMLTRGGSKKDDLMIYAEYETKLGNPALINKLYQLNITNAN
ncbi:MAG TPA: hypothetical protein DCG75_04385 [Bacteroidales bacterium]|jgi:hypothetical protein|nr:hypothetical protein [Bacteroidales bacterium]